MYDGILSESLINPLWLCLRLLVLQCYWPILYLQKLVTYSSSSSVTTFLHLFGFLITSFTADYLTWSWWDSLMHKWWGIVRKKQFPSPRTSTSLKFLFFSFYMDKNIRTLVYLPFPIRKYRVMSCCISQPVSSCLSLVYSHSKYLSVNYKFVISFKVVYFNKGIDLSFFISKWFSDYILFSLFHSFYFFCSVSRGNHWNMKPCIPDAFVNFMFNLIFPVLWRTFPLLVTNVFPFHFSLFFILNKTISPFQFSEGGSFFYVGEPSFQRIYFNLFGLF